MLLPASLRVRYSQRQDRQTLHTRDSINSADSVLRISQLGRLRLLCYEETAYLDCDAPSFNVAIYHVGML